jgi:hypothetical protein
MMCFNVPFVNGNIPYLNVTNVTVGTQAVDLALGFRNIRPVGLMLVRISSAIPTGTTGTLPVTLTLNGNTRPLTFFNGTAVTVADLEGTGVLLVFNDKFNGILQLLSTPAATA